MRPVAARPASIKLWNPSHQTRFRATKYGVQSSASYLSVCAEILEISDDACPPVLSSCPVLSILSITSNGNAIPPPHDPQRPFDESRDAVDGNGNGDGDKQGSWMTDPLIFLCCFEHPRTP